VVRLLLLKQGMVLFELTVWTHLFAASIYGNYLWRRIQQFWRVGCVSLFAYSLVVRGAISLLALSDRWQLHAVFWVFLFLANLLAGTVEAYYLQRLRELRTPKGYEHWLYLAEERARRAARWRM